MSKRRIQFGIPDEDKTDRAYWDQPLWYRIYMRIIYALGGFVITGAFFDLWTPLPFWAQVVLASCVALATLLFRVAYPNGFSDIQEWINEGMRQAAEEMETQGKSSGEVAKRSNVRNNKKRN